MASESDVIRTDKKTPDCCVAAVSIGPAKGGTW
jgi:hypothetical protein